MVSTFTTNKHIEEPAHGDDVGTWDVPVNSNWSLIDTAYGGTLLLNATALTGNQALTNVQLQPPTIQISGAPSAAVTYTIPSGVGGLWVVRNTTSGGKTIGILSLAGGSTVTIPAGLQLGVWCDGSATGVLVSNSVFSSSGVTFPDGTVQSSAVAVSTQNVSGVSTIDFTGIPTTTNNLQLSLNLTLSSTVSVLGLQFYISTVLDTGANYVGIATINISGTVSGGVGAGTTYFGLGTWSNAFPTNGQVSLQNIQDTGRTQGVGTLVGVDNTNSFQQLLTIGASHAIGTGGPITGIRVLTTVGTFTGRVTLTQTI